MAKKTVVKVDELKAALKDLTDLQHAMSPGNSDSAVAYTADLDSIGQGLGPLLEDAGPTITKYVDARKTALVQVHNESAQSVGTVAMLLQTTITNYENNENMHRTAADGTDTTGGGSGSGGGADQKG